MDPIPCLRRSRSAMLKNEVTLCGDDDDDMTDLPGRLEKDDGRVRAQRR